MLNHLSPFSFRIAAIWLWLILLSPVVLAQPQAPITWSPKRAILSTTTYNTNKMASKGDTIVALCSYWTVEAGSFPAIKISSNNGQTWSNWSIVGDTNISSGTGLIKPVITTQGILVSSRSRWMGGNGFYRTTNLGQTWIAPTTLLPGLYLLGQTGDTVFVRSSSRFVCWTNDGGVTYQDNQQFLSNDITYYLTLSVGSNHEWMYLACNYAPPNESYRARIFRRRINGGPFSEPFIINPNLCVTRDAKITIDDEGHALLLTTGNNDYNEQLNYYGVLLNTSIDNGFTWSDWQVMRRFHTAYEYANVVSRCGRLLGIHTADSLWDPGSQIADSQPFSRFAISANHGRSWYPFKLVSTAPQSNAQHSVECDLLSTDLQPNRVRLYTLLRVSTADTTLDNSFYQVEGIIHPDTLPPVVSTLIDTATVYAPEQIVHFRAYITDNDSVWKPQWVIRDSLTGDSLVFDMLRDSTHWYSVGFAAPMREGRYQCYFRAEDMWENVGYAPENVPTEYYTLTIGNASAPPPIQLPYYKTLRIYPNPGNPQFTISGTSSSWGIPQQVKIYNVMGQLVRSIPIPRNTIQQFQVVWDGRTESGKPAVSGTYFVTVEPAHYREMLLLSVEK